MSGEVQVRRRLNKRQPVPLRQEDDRPQISSSGSDSKSSCFITKAIFFILLGACLLLITLQAVDYQQHQLEQFYNQNVPVQVRRAIKNGFYQTRDILSTFYAKFQYSYRIGTQKLRNAARNVKVGDTNLEKLLFFNEIAEEKEAAETLKKVVENVNKMEESSKSQEEELKRKQKEELKRKQEEELKRRQEEELKKKKEEEERLRRQEEELKRKKEEELKRKHEEELKRKKEEELKRKQEEESKRKQEEELKRKLEEERLRRQEEELKRKKEEELKRKQEEEEKLRRQEEELKRKQEEELLRKQEEEKRQQEEELKRQQEEELKRKQEEELKRKQEEELKKKQEEELKRRQEEEKRRQQEELKRKQEEELKRKQEEQLKKKQDEELKRRQEEEKRRQQEELKRKQEEEEKRRQEEELKKKQEEELKRRQEEEKRRQEEELKKKQEEELKRKQEEELKKKQEEELKKKQEEELKRKQAEEKRQQEEELKKKKEEEERLRRQEEELKRKQEEEKKRQEEELKRKQEEELKKKKEEEERLRRQEEELKRKQEEEVKRQEQQRQEEENREKEAAIKKQEEELRKREEQKKRLQESIEKKKLEKAEEAAKAPLDREQGEKIAEKREAGKKAPKKKSSDKEDEGRIEAAKEAAKLAKDLSEKTDRRLAEAQTLIDAEPQKALTIFETIFEETRLVKALLGKARATDKLADINRSNKLLEKAIELFLQVINHPEVDRIDLIEVGKYCAQRMQFRGWSSKAINVLEFVSKKYEDLDVLNLLGTQHLIMGRNDMAKDIYAQVLRSDSRNKFASKHLGFVLKVSGTEQDLPLAVDLLAQGIQGDPNPEGKFHYQLGDGLRRLGRDREADLIFEDGVNKKLFLSFWQRSLYNVDHLEGKPVWSKESTGIAQALSHLEKNWEAIRDEGLALLKNFDPEAENLQDTGDWGQLELFRQGRRQSGCQKAPKTCQMVSQIPEAATNKRGQVKFSVMHPKTHVHPHSGPTNCRLRCHLGLVVPSQDPSDPKDLKLRVADQFLEWEAGKFLIFDDSFDHEVWHNRDRLRLVLIMDIWHPGLSGGEREQLSPI